MKVLVTGASGMIGRRALRRPVRPRRHGRRPQPRPRQGARGQPAGRVAQVGADPRTAARRGASRASTASSTWSARRSTSAGPTRRSGRSWRRGGPRPTTSCRRSRGSASEAGGAGQPVGGRLLRRPRRRGRRRGAAARARASTPRSAVEWEKAARGVEAAGVRLVIVRTGQVLDPDGGMLGELLTPFKLGVGGPLAGGAPVRPLDPPRRRGRDPALGARHRGGQRRRQRHRARARPPTRSSPRRWDGRWGGRRCCRSRASSSTSNSAPSSARCCAAASGWCRSGRWSSATSSSTRSSTRPCGTCV